MGYLPPKFILSVRPKEYLIQNLSHCGAYSIKAILSAYGKDDKEKPEDYHSDFFNRLKGGLTSSKHYWSEILGKYGIDAELKSAKRFTDEEK